jgi:hypothetical protein
MVVKDAAERSSRAAESALASERAARARVEGMLRDAEGTIRDLREKLATANQTIHGMQAELVAELQSREQADATPRPAITVPKTIAAPVRDVVAPTVRRPVGRPRKIAVAEPVESLIGRLNEPRSSSKDEAPSNRDAAAPAGRRPVGRPRKMTAAQPVEQPIRAPRQPQVVGTSATKSTASRTDDEEPVQWWVEGWKER